MTPNQTKFVKSGVRQKRPERRESLNFKGIPFDTVPAKSSAQYLPACSMART
jgi:hypothetical protein